MIKRRFVVNQYQYVKFCFLLVEASLVLTKFPPDSNMLNLLKELSIYYANNLMLLSTFKI